MIRLGLSEFHADLSSAALAALQAEFAEFHTFQIRGFLDPELVSFLLDRIQPEDFQPKIDGKIAVELAVRTKTNIGVQSLQLRMNDRGLSAFLETVSGIKPLKHFEGRVYRMAPGSEHHDSWHDDIIHGRRIGVSINLSPDPYLGGTFRMKYRESGELIRVMPNLGPGDAIFFRIDDPLLHMVSKMEGHASKTAFAGWFHDTATLTDMLRRPTVVETPTPAS